MKKKSPETQNEPTVIMTANGKAESMGEATVNVNDFDVLVLLEDSLAVLSLVFFCAKN